MSPTELLLAHDESLFEQLVRHHRAAAAVADADARVDLAHPAILALRAALTAAVVPRTADRERAIRELPDLERRGAPRRLLDLIRARADPQAAALRDLDGGLLPTESAVLRLSARAEMPLHDAFRRLCWLADPRRRDVVATHDHWPYVTCAAPDPAIDELLLGTSPLVVDGRSVDAFALPYRTDRRVRMHRPADLPRVRGFILDLLRREPPPIDVYRRCHPVVHAAYWSLTTDPQLPADAALPWDYARFLADLHRYIERLARFLANAARRRWSVVVYIE